MPATFFKQFDHAPVNATMDVSQGKHGVEHSQLSQINPPKKRKRPNQTLKKYLE